MSKKLKTYENFGKIEDANYEKEIDEILESLVKQKMLISMLNDTISHVSETIEKIFPHPAEQFMEVLHHYEDTIHDSVQLIRETMIEGVPNIIDMMQDVEYEFDRIEEYLKNKKEE
jgi:anion-transporting  ArsA/GET3 family ATPase